MPPYLNHTYKFFFFCCILVVGSFHTAVGQENRTYHIEVVDGQSVDLLPSYDQLQEVKDSLSWITLLQSDLIQLWSEGYLTASLDTIVSSDSTIVAKVFVGEGYRFGDVSISSRDLAIVEAAGLKNVRWREKTLSMDMVDEYSKTLLTYLEDHGYPFARVQLDSTEIDGEHVHARLTVNRNRYVPFDSIAVIGDLDIRKGYLSRYLNIKANDPYSRSKIKNVTKRINDLSFIELDSTPVIKFANNFAQVQLYAKPKKASRFDFLIGILPSSDSGSRRISVIGEFTGEMYNKLGHGEYIFANIQSRPETRVLDVRFKYPYLFNLPLGADFKGGIFFNEVFRETIWDAGILYQFDGGSSVKASWNNKSSRLIDIDTTSILQQGRLPNQLDITYNGGGLEYTYRNVDYRFNPTRGLELQVKGTIGLKKIIRNNRIESLSTSELDFRLAYDTLKLNTLQTEVKLSAAYYLPAFNVSTFRLSLEGGMQYNQERIYDNELYRIGGNALLRGFDEQSILASTYLVSSLEFRLLLDRNSYLSFPFVDYGLTRISIDDEMEWDTALSFGMGINFATPAGIFNVSFAAGRRLDNPFDFGNTKIHFGYVSLF